MRTNTITITITNEPTKFYRIEHIDSTRSLWYKPDGTYDPFIEKLTEGKAKILPMGFDSTYSDYGTNWYSALYDVENAHYWFSDLDAYELMKNDYRLYEIVAKNIRKKEHELMFTQEGVMFKKEIPIQDIWDIDKFDKDRDRVINKIIIKE